MIRSIKFNTENTARVLRNIRIASGMKQSEVAKRLHMSSSATVSHFETGSRGITIDKLRAIADVFGFDVQIVLIKRHERRIGNG